MRFKELIEGRWHGERRVAGGHLGRDEDVTDLRARSIDVIAAGQAPSGAYSAAPTFGQYRDYCWFRDGSFTADAMSRVGETASAERFFDWGAEIVRAKPAGPWDARYRLDGSHDEPLGGHTTSSTAPACGHGRRTITLRGTASRPAGTTQSNM